MALASERLVVQISAEDKKRVEAKAARAGAASTADFVRRAALNYEPAEDADEAELRALLKALDGMHAKTLKQLDRTDRALDAALRHFARRRA
jgi:hypothetical protein